MVIDCLSCTARGGGCSDCAATTLLAPAGGPAAECPDLDPAELRALNALASAASSRPCGTPRAWPAPPDKRACSGRVT